MSYKITSLAIFGAFLAGFYAHYRLQPPKTVIQTKTQTVTQERVVYKDGKVSERFITKNEDKAVAQSKPSESAKSWKKDYSLGASYNFDKTANASVGWRVWGDLSSELLLLNIGSNEPKIGLGLRWEF
jgi:hypothetical protein